MHYDIDITDVGDVRRRLGRIAGPGTSLDGTLTMAKALVRITESVESTSKEERTYEARDTYTRH